MRVSIEHITRFEYDEPVCESATEVRLQPADNNPLVQRLLAFKLTVQPVVQVFGYSDFFGNTVHHFTIVPNHKSVQISAISTVETGSGDPVPTEESGIKIYDFLHETRYVHFDAAVRQFAEQFRYIGDPLAMATAIAERIHEVLIYEPGVTGVHSTSAEVIALGRGVCQDFSQLMIATCRYLGVACRYVSGYLYGGARTEFNDQASHAWCEIYTGPETGWIGFDPTHPTLRVDGRYIRIGAGRDYSDVPPVRGVYKGNATEQLHVAVRVMAAEAIR